MSKSIPRRDDTCGIWHTIGHTIFKPGAASTSRNTRTVDDWTVWVTCGPLDRLWATSDQTGHHAQESRRLKASTTPRKPRRPERRSRCAEARHHVASSEPQCQWFAIAPKRRSIALSCRNPDTGLHTWRLVRPSKGSAWRHSVAADAGRSRLLPSHVRRTHRSTVGRPLRMASPSLRACCAG